MISQYIIPILSALCVLLFGLLFSVSKLKNNKISKLNTELQNSKIKSETQDKETAISKTVAQIVLSTLTSREDTLKALDSLKKEITATMTEEEAIKIANQQAEIEKERRANEV